MRLRLAIVGMSALLLAARATSAAPPEEIYCHGRVVDLDGHPVAGARVAVHHEDTLRLYETRRWLAFDYEVPAPDASGVTDTTGTFRIVTARRGLFGLSADARGHGRAVIDGVPAASGDVPKMRVVMPKVGPREGEIVDAAGRPLAGARVCALVGFDRRNTDPTEGVLRRHVTVTDARGRWRLDDAPAPRVDGRDSSLMYVRAVAGDAICWVGYADSNGALPARMTVGGDATLRVRLSGVDGRAIRGRAFATVSPARRAPQWGFAAFRAASGSDGVVVVKGLPAGDIEGIAAAADGGLRGARELPISLEAGQVTEAEVRLGPAFEVAGVVRAPDRTPIVGARVWGEYFPDVEGESETVTDGEGRFRLRTPGESAQVVVAADDWVMGEGSRSVRATRGGPLAPVEIEMVRTGVIAGTVFGANGEGCVGAIVVPDALGGGMATRSGEGGRFLHPRSLVKWGTVMAHMPATREYGEVAVKLPAGGRRDGLVIRLRFEPEIPLQPPPEIGPAAPAEPPPETELPPVPPAPAPPGDGTPPKPR